MGNLKETFLKKYGVWEYVLIIIGILVCYSPIRYLILIDFENASWEVITIVIFVLLFGILLIAAPLSILDYGRKKLGLEPKNQK